MTGSSTDWKTAVHSLRAARRVVVFTGAGVSAESGIATFRDEQGFWQRFPPEDFANWKGLLRMAVVQPKLLADFLLAVLGPIATAQPNAAHRALAELEQHVPVTVVTQNIDGLHQAAGSSAVFEVHGSLFEIVRFPSGDLLRTLSRGDLCEMVQQIRYAHDHSWTSARLLLAIQPLLGIGGQGAYRPNLVLFGDAMAEPAWSNGLQAARECDCLLTVGTSGSVYPAAILPDEARSHGAKVICIDPVTSGAGDIWLKGSAGEVLPRLMTDVFGPV